jgi:hypothetical protein
MNIRDLEMITLFVRLAFSQQMEPICVRRKNFFLETTFSKQKNERSRF